MVVRVFVRVLIFDIQGVWYLVVRVFGVWLSRGLAFGCQGTWSSECLIFSHKGVWSLGCLVFGCQGVWDLVVMVVDF